MDESQATGRIGLLQFLEQIHSQYGLVVLMLVLIIGFGCFLFWKLIWKVWSSALMAKNQEIARLARERDVYKAMAFDCLRSTKPLALQERAARENH